MTSRNSPQTTTQSEYTTPYYVTNEQAKAAIKCLKNTAKSHHIKDKDTEHIRPLWVAQSQGSQILQTDCEVTQGWLQHPTSPQSPTAIWPGMTRTARSTKGTH